MFPIFKGYVFIFSVILPQFKNIFTKTIELLHFWMGEMYENSISIKVFKKTKLNSIQNMLCPFFLKDITEI